MVGKQYLESWFTDCILQTQVCNPGFQPKNTHSIDTEFGIGLAENPFLVLKLATKQLNNNMWDSK